MSQQFTNSLYDQFQFNPMSTNNTQLVLPLKQYNNAGNNNNNSNRNAAQIYPVIQNVNSPDSPITTKLEPLLSTNSMSPTFKTDDMPSLAQYPGQYNFNIFVPNGEYDETKRKGQTCVFQTTKDGTHQLFTKPSPHYWRLNYSVDQKYLTDITNTNNQNDTKLYVRLVPVFGDPEKAQSVLERCPRHKETMIYDNTSSSGTNANGSLVNASNSNELSKTEIMWRQRSMVLVEKSSACYMQDPLTKRVCVLLPWETPAEGQEYASINCQFACFNSCFIQDSGGRKTLYLIVTLERLDLSDNKGRREVLGRQCLQFRSCACPGRDWRDRKGQHNQSTSSLRGSKRKGDGSSSKTNFFDTSNSSSNSNATNCNPANLTSTPIYMGKNDAIIRVLPSLPGLDEAVNALFFGFLYRKSLELNKSSREPIEVFRQCKEIENRIIEKLTTTYDPIMDSQIQRSASISPNDSQISPSNTHPGLSLPMSTIPLQHNPYNAPTTTSPLTNDFANLQPQALISQQLQLPQQQQHCHTNTFFSTQQTTTSTPINTPNVGMTGYNNTNNNNTNNNAPNNGYTQQTNSHNDNNALPPNLFSLPTYTAAIQPHFQHMKQYNDFNSYNDLKPASNISMSFE